MQNRERSDYMTNAIYVWGALIVLFLIIEAATAQLVTIWFAAGALAALIASALGAGTAVQIVVFVVVSAVTLAATRPLVKKITNKKEARLNADRCIGQFAIVTEAINNIEGTGLAKADGKIWSARSSDGSVIPEGAQVKVDRIEGVKLIVSPPSDITGFYMNNTKE